MLRTLRVLLDNNDQRPYIATSAVVSALASTKFPKELQVIVWVFFYGG